MKTPVIKNLDSPEEIRRLTEELLGDATDDTIRTFVHLLENFKNADAEDAYDNIGIAQRTAFSKSISFENAFRAFAGLPRVPSSEEDETAAAVWNYESKAEN